MARTATITLDGQDYTVHAFNLKELREVMELLAEGNRTTSGMDVITIALRRAEPAADVNALEPTIPELTEATSRILKLAGLVNPQTVAPTAN